MEMPLCYNESCLGLSFYGEENAFWCAGPTPAALPPNDPISAGPLPRQWPPYPNPACHIATPTPKGEITIKELHLKVFISELSRQCEFASYSFNAIRDCLATHNRNGVWYHVQSFLIATANISKLLWNSKESIKGRTRALRDALGVPEDSLLKSRNMRNNFEHFDERLETWALKHGRVFVSNNIGPIGLFDIPGVSRDSYLRNLDPATLQLTFQGQTYDLPSIMVSLNTLNSSITKYNIENDPFSHH